MNKHQIFASISKVEENDDGTIDIFGTASTETKDAQGETVTKGCMEDALPDYFAHGTGALRAMHQPIAAGYVYKAAVNSEGCTEIAAKVVDPVEVLKCKTGVYKGFSIGGKQVPGGYDAKTKTITKMKLTEISLVDRPANPEATITMWKGEGIEEEEVEVKVTKEGESDINKLAEMINKGEISTSKVLELATAEIAKAAGPGDVKEPPADESKGVKEPPPAEVKKVEEVAAKEGDVPPEVKKVDKPVAVEAAKIEKGIYGVRSLAQVLDDIRWITSDAIYEAQSENDNSPVPARLVAWFKDGAAILAEMTAEETGEIASHLDKLNPNYGITVQMADKADGIRKSLSATDTLVGFLSAAKEYMPEDEIGKALFNGKDIAENKAALIEVIAKEASGAVDVKKVAGLEESIKKLEGENSDLQKRIKELESKPADTKAVLRVINKTDDVVLDDARKDDDKPITKADGSVDYEATALNDIKKIHQSGGNRLSR